MRMMLRVAMRARKVMRRMGGCATGVGIICEYGGMCAGMGAPGPAGPRPVSMGPSETAGAAPFADRIHPHDHTARRGAPPPHLCHHLPPRRGQDHPHREAAALRRCHPDRGQRQGAQGVAPCHVRLDGDREAARHLGGQLGDADGVPRLRHQPAGHPGPQGLLGRHLSGADGRGCRPDGHRCRQRRRAADAAPAGGVPGTQYAHHHLHQQDGPRGARAAGDPRRDREHAGHAHGALHLAGGHGQELRRRHRPEEGTDARLPRRAGPCWRRGRRDPGRPGQ